MNLQNDCESPYISETDSHLDDNEQVAQANNGQWQEKSNKEGVEYEGFGKDILRLRPYDATHWHLVQSAEDHSWQDDNQRDAPYCQVN